MDINYISGNKNICFYFILLINYILNKYLKFWFSVNLYSLCCYSKYIEVIFCVYNMYNIK